MLEKLIEQDGMCATCDQLIGDYSILHKNGVHHIGCINSAARDDFMDRIMLATEVGRKMRRSWTSFDRVCDSCWEEEKELTDSDKERRMEGSLAL